MKEDLRPLFLIVRLLMFRTSARHLHGKGVLFYLKTLKTARTGVLATLLIFLFLQTMMLAFLGTITTVVFLSVDHPETRLWILLGVFGLMFLIPLIGVFALFSEKIWYRASGAEKMVQEYSDYKKADSATIASVSDSSH